ncbi:unnamed protein product, partial [Didymodactylos carnosus]
EESQKQKRERQRAVQPTLTPQATKSTNAVTTVNSKPQSKPLPLPTTTADLIPVPTVAVLSDSMASRIRQNELQSPHATIKLYSQSGATIDKLIEYVYSNDGTHFLSDIRQVLLIVGTNDLSDKYPDDMIKSITMMYNNIRYRFPQIQKVFIHKVFPRKKPTKLFPSLYAVNAQIDRYNELLDELSTTIPIIVVKTDILENDLFDKLHLIDPA